MSVRTTAILNLKGGVAKTTTAINMAAILAKRHKKRVLLIDADSQCNATEFFGGQSASGNLANLLRYSANLATFGMEYCRMQIQATTIDGVFILPGEDSLMDLDLTKVEQGSISASILRTLVKALESDYDYILIDCPPAFNAACAAALVAANDVIIPIKLDAFSLRGMANLMRQIKNMRDINPALQLCGCLPTMWYRDPEIMAAEAQLQSAGLRVFHHIRRSDMVDKMTFRQSPLTISSPKSGAGVDYAKFVAEYLRGVGNG